MADGVPITPTAPVQPSQVAVCSFCGKQVPADAVFCPFCGKQLKEKTVSTTLFTQIALYALAVLLPPLGLWPGIKYFRNSDEKAQKIGIALIVLTIASTIITVWLTFAFLNSYMNELNQALNGTGLY